MNYNDFPILNNEDYLLINSHYENKVPFDRKKNLYKIISTISLAKTICCNLANKYNSQIQKEIANIFTTFTKLEDNLISIFNLSDSTQHTTRSFNIFSLQKSTAEIIELILNWNQHEPKQYYKTISHNFTCELLTSLNKLILSMEKSKID